MVNKKYCQKCGNPSLDLAANFCGKCGSPFNAQASTQQTPRIIVANPKKQISAVIPSEEDEAQGLPIESLNEENLGFEAPNFVQNKTRVQDILGSVVKGKDTEEFHRPKLPKQSKKKFFDSFRNEAGGGAIKPIEID